MLIAFANKTIHQNPDIVYSSNKYKTIKYSSIQNFGNLC